MTPHPPSQCPTNGCPYCRYFEQDETIPITYKHDEPSTFLLFLEYFVMILLSPIAIVFWFFLGLVLVGTFLVELFASFFKKPKQN